MREVHGKEEKNSMPWQEMATFPEGEIASKKKDEQGGVPVTSLCLGVGKKRVTSTALV